MGVVIASAVSTALASLVVRCAPSVGPTTMTAIVARESGARPYAIGDNTARRSYDSIDATHAVVLAQKLIRAGHDIDVGLAQVNSSNFAAYGLDAARAFDPCVNVATGSRILRAAYARAVRLYGPGPLALTYALSAYNTGGFFSGFAYARDVYATAAALRFAGTRTRRRVLAVGRPPVVAAPARAHRAARAVPFYAAHRESGP